MKNVLKIGIDARMFSDSFTGIGRYNFEITKRLFAKEFLLNLAGEKQKIQWVIFLNEPEFSLFHFPETVKKVCVGAPHYSFSEQTKFLKILNKEACDLVHFTHFNFPVFYRRKFIVTIHDTTLSFFPGKNTSFLKKIAYKLVIKMAAKRSKNIIAVSNNTKKDIQMLFGVLAEKIKTIYNGVSEEFFLRSVKPFSAIQKKYNIDSLYLLYTGVWREHKNLSKLFQALERIYKKNQNFPSMVLTGTPDSEILKIAEAGNFRKKIFPVGKIPKEDLICLMQSAKGFVFPSLYEGFGIPPLESMACGVPVAVSNTSSMPEACGNEALYFDPASVSEIVLALESLVQNEQNTLKLQQKRIDQALKFSWDTSANETFVIYQKSL